MSSVKLNCLNGTVYSYTELFTVIRIIISSQSIASEISSKNVRNVPKNPPQFFCSKVFVVKVCADVKESTDITIEHNGIPANRPDI